MSNGHAKCLSLPPTGSKSTIAQFRSELMRGPVRSSPTPMSWTHTRTKPGHNTEAVET